MSFLTIPAIRLTRDISPDLDRASSFQMRPADVTFEFPETNVAFRYQITDHSNGELPEIAFQGLVGLRLDGRDFLTALDASIGRVSFADGEAEIALFSIDVSEDRRIDYLVHLSGDPLPTLNSIERLQDFSATSTFSAINTGRNAPGVEINLAERADALFRSDAETENTLLGTRDADFLFGSAGDDLIEGRAKGDKINAGAGDDFVFGQNGPDTISGRQGDDNLYGNAGNDSLFGNAGSDIIEGGRGADQLFGGSRNDVLNGGAGNDLLSGGRGFDFLTGGLGRDIFSFTQGDFRATVTDFTDGLDKVMILEGAEDFSDLFLRQIGEDAGVVVRFGTVRISLEGIDLGSVDASDFIF